jgi:16S rRNA processing protein RimM
MESSYRNIGKIVSVFGLKGEIIVQHHLGKRIAVAKIKVIFLEQKKEELLPYFVEAARKKGEDDLYIKLEGIDNKEAAAKFLRREVWIKEDEMQSHIGKNNPIVWVGYRIFDQGKDLGPVLEVIEQTHQVFCRLAINNKEVLIPINEQTLQKIDHKSRVLSLSLPDGLLEVYLS